MTTEHWSITHHEDDFEDNLLEEFEDIEEDEQDAYTRCEKCGLRLKLKELKQHKEVMHGKRKSD